MVVQAHFLIEGTVTGGTITEGVFVGAMTVDGMVVVTVGTRVVEGTIVD